LKPSFSRPAGTQVRTFASSSTPETATSSSTAKAATTGRGGGAGFFQRLSSFIVGAGVTALISQYYIHREIVEGNTYMIEKQRDIEDRLYQLEKRLK